jgi:hypothetical protein
LARRLPVVLDKTYFYVQQEAVQLRLRKGIGASLLNGILGGKYEERFFKIVRLAGVGYRKLLHGL